MAIKDTISRLRREKGLTQYKFALMIGVSPHTVRSWENGAYSSIHPRNIEKLRIALNLTQAEVVNLFCQNLETQQQAGR